MVEDAQDKAPMKDDPIEATKAIDALKQMLYVKDSWQDTFPTRRAYFFTQDATSSMSRIDRIYMTDHISVSA